MFNSCLRQQVLAYELTFKTTRIKCLLGDSEKAVREIFQRAKDCEPCLIFFDEFDALCPERSSTVIFYK